MVPKCFTIMLNNDGLSDSDKDSLHAMIFMIFLWGTQAASQACQASQQAPPFLIYQAVVIYLVPSYTGSVQDMLKKVWQEWK